MVFIIVAASVYLDFKGRPNNQLNYLMTAIAIIQAYVILRYEVWIDDKQRQRSTRQSSKSNNK